MRFTTAILSVLPLVSFSIAAVLPTTNIAARDYPSSFGLQYICPKYSNGGSGGGLLGDVLGLVGDVVEVVDDVLGDVLGPDGLVQDVLCLVDGLLVDISKILFYLDGETQYVYYLNNGVKYWGYTDSTGCLNFGPAIPSGCHPWTFSSPSQPTAPILPPNGGSGWTACPFKNGYKVWDSRYAPSGGISINIYINISLQKLPSPGPVRIGESDALWKRQLISQG
ncbi:hypothetical protein RUND412_005474 [Rhizina undulata]